MILGDSSGDDNHEIKAPKKRAEMWVQDETRSLIGLRREFSEREDGCFVLGKIGFVSRYGFGLGLATGANRRPSAVLDKSTVWLFNCITLSWSGSSVVDIVQYK
ncbi:hypothetical protein OIU74_010723 [Salix koriyanagi]|uniref:Uncharacterized protein n=1 Tax=Salix koriyanagi TaxID=2511006 RepID=A0A9Q0YSQ8_9ROSI|nr:hypothetical protein OIU74_010723 [Salix koriyanagi]